MSRAAGTLPWSVPYSSRKCLLGSRRGRQYVFRWIYGGWLILQLAFGYLAYAAAFDYHKDATGEFATAV